MNAGQWYEFSRAEWRDFDNAVWDDDRLEGHRLMGALALAWFADASGCAVVSAPTLAKKANVSVRTVFYALESLEGLGYVERVNRMKKRQTLANRYRLLVPKAC